MDYSQASLSSTIFLNLLRLTSIESVMPSNHLILCHLLLLRPLIPRSISVFSNESALPIRWPKYCSFSFYVSPSNEHPGLISFRMNSLDLLAVQKLSRVFFNTTVQKHQFFDAQLFFFFKFYFIFKLYVIVLVLSNIKMNPPVVYMCSPS